MSSGSLCQISRISNPKQSPKVRKKNMDPCLRNKVVCKRSPQKTMHPHVMCLVDFFSMTAECVRFDQCGPIAQSAGVKNTPIEPSGFASTAIAQESEKKRTNALGCSLHESWIMATLQTGKKQKKMPPNPSTGCMVSRPQNQVCKTARSTTRSTVQNSS